ncbi:PH domain-containing protein [Flavobacterium sp. MFBS3-15]|uniref:PH domain-containing protein n=1 Tax=Flavobacterium sp. MFBS3-15 TaxID=2989816 RepID=UPI002235E7E6|nr:PH domain-containing protein [Flavobacterium sp. MFBS3-15]MCW4469425.1 PH domain-containing protein [Flavobacterium sp. MFBS3-15]
MKIYRSKIDLWLFLLIFGILGGILIESILVREWLVLAIILPVIIFIALLMYSLRYIIDGDVLEIRTGILGKTKIPISGIKSVEKTRNPLSAPAMSLKRLEIMYGKYDFALISPTDRDAFINDLLEINPGIQVKF